MDALRFGTAGLRGWRAKVGDAVARPAARHSSFSPEQIQAVVGAAFFLLSLTYVIRTLRSLRERS